MKTKTIRKGVCKHCLEEFIIQTSTQKFCCASHRVANFAMNKRATTQKLPRNIEQAPLTGVSTPPELGGVASFLKDVGSATAGGLIIDRVKSLRGINDNDQMKFLKRIEQNQIRFQMEVLLKFACLEEAIRKNNSTKFYQPVILQN